MRSYFAIPYKIDSLQPTTELVKEVVLLADVTVLRRKTEGLPAGMVEVHFSSHFFPCLYSA